MRPRAAFRRDFRANVGFIMSYPESRTMNCCWPPTTNQTEMERGTAKPHPRAGGGPTSQTLNPSPTHLHRPPRRPGTSPPPKASEALVKLCTHVKAKTPLTRGNAVPEVGLEPQSRPRKHRELQTPYRVRPNPADIRPSPKPNPLTLSTPPFLTEFEEHRATAAPVLGGAAVALSSVATASGQLVLDASVRDRFVRSNLVTTVPLRRSHRPEV